MAFVNLTYLSFTAVQFIIFLMKFNKDAFFDAIQSRTEKKLTLRKAKKLYKQQNRTFISEVLDWLDAIVFAVFVVLLINQYLFQLFVIPSPSMLETLQIGDRVSVSKITYGVELWPEGPKILDSREPQRDEIITFYNPEFEKRSTFFNIMSKVLYMGTFSLVNIDRDEDGNIRESLLVKRTAAVAGDTVTFRNGQAYIKAGGSYDYVNEADFREENGLSTAPHRTIEPETYRAYNAQGVLEGLQSKGLTSYEYPRHLINDYKTMNKNAFYTDYYEYSKHYFLGQRIADPTDMEARSTWTKMNTGLYVPEGYVLPLGDNRDNSSDGRYFGPVPVESVNGHVTTRIWPLKTIGSIH